MSDQPISADQLLELLVKAPNGVRLLALLFLTRKYLLQAIKDPASAEANSEKLAEVIETALSDAPVALRNWAITQSLSNTMVDMMKDTSWLVYDAPENTVQ